jgi:hypothetical protein
MQYHAAHLIGLTEYFITAFFVNDHATSSNSILAFRTWWMGYGSLFGTFTPIPS